MFLGASNMRESRLHKLTWTDMELVQGFIRVNEPSNSLKTSVYSTSNKKQQNLKLKKALCVKPGSISRRLVGRWAHFFSPDRFKYSKNHIGSRKSWSVRSWRKNSFISAKRSSLISFSLLTIGLGKRNETGWNRKKILIGLFKNAKFLLKASQDKFFFLHQNDHQRLNGETEFQLVGFSGTKLDLNLPEGLRRRVGRRRCRRRPTWCRPCPA